MSSCIHRILIIGRTLVVTAFLSSTLSFAIPTGQAAELQVEVTISIREPVAEIATAFEKRTGHKVKMTVAAPGEIFFGPPSRPARRCRHRHRWRDG